MDLAVDDDDVVAGLDGRALRAGLLLQPGWSGRGREGEGRRSSFPLVVEKVRSVGEERLEVGVRLILRLLHHKLEEEEESVEKLELAHMKVLLSILWTMWYLVVSNQKAQSDLAYHGKAI